MAKEATNSSKLKTPDVPVEVQSAAVVASLISAPGTGGGVMANEFMLKKLKELGIDPATLMKMQVPPGPGQTPRYDSRLRGV